MVTNYMIILFITMKVLEANTSGLRLGGMLGNTLVRSATYSISCIFGYTMSLTAGKRLFRNVAFLDCTMGYIPFLGTPCSFKSCVRGFCPATKKKLFFTRPVTGFKLGFTVFFSKTCVLLLTELMEGAAGCEFVMCTTLYVAVFEAT